MGLIHPRLVRNLVQVNDMLCERADFSLVDVVLSTTKSINGAVGA